MQVAENLTLFHNPESDKLMLNRISQYQVNTIQVGYTDLERVSTILRATAVAHKLGHHPDTLYVLRNHIFMVVRQLDAGKCESICLAHVNPYRRFDYVVSEVADLVSADLAVYSAPMVTSGA